jgi:hypothetical protein
VFSNSPVPKALLDRLDALSPKPITRELTPFDLAIWVQTILRWYERGDRSPNVLRIVEILSTLKARKALLDRPIDELA